VYKITGKLEGKTLIKEGKSKYGEWRLVEFIIKKTILKKKRVFLLKAGGKWADFIQEIQVGEKINVRFIPEAKEYNGKYYTNLNVIDIDKYVNKTKVEAYAQLSVEIPKSDYEIEKDNQLFTSENEVQDKEES
jgi:hypothetical protein